MCVVLFPLSFRELVFWGWWNVYLWTPLCYFVAILHLFSQSLSIVLRWGSDAECHLRLPERQVYSMAMLCPDQSFLSLCHRRSVGGLSMLYKVNSNSDHCLYSEHPSASTRFRHTHPLVFEVSRCRTSQSNLLGLSCLLRFECGMTFRTQCLTPERWMGSRVQSTVGCFLRCVVFSFLRRRCFWGLVAKAIKKQLCFPHLGLRCWF